MTPKEFESGRKFLGLSKYALAKLFQVAGSSTTIFRWESGARMIPGPAKVLMRWLVSGKRPDIPVDQRFKEKTK